MASKAILQLSQGVRTAAPRLVRPSSARLLASAAPRAEGAYLSYTYPQSLLNVPETRVTTLKNGLRVATEDSNLETATVGVWIDAGSRFETDKSNGTAHFLEHMAFKGTKKRTQSGLEVEVENIGAHLNAYTSREQTAYYAKVFKKDIAQAVDILADILQNSNFDAAAIEAERSVILREQQEVNKELQEVVFDHLHATAYQRQPLGRTILGSEENIKSIKRDDLVDYIKKNYTAPRMVLAASGGVDHEQLVALAEKNFGGLSSERHDTKSAAARFVASEIRLRDDDMDEAHIVFANEGVSWTNPDYFPLLVAQSVIGSWDRTLGGGANLSSRLAQAVANEKMANRFMAFNTCYSDTGLFGIYMVSSERAHLDDLVYLVQQEITRLSQSATETEVTRAKNQLKTTLLLQLDGTTPVCEDIGRQILTYGRRLTPFEVDARIEAVDAAAVRRVVYKYLYDKDPALVGLGPIESMPDYNRVQTATSWLRV